MNREILGHLAAIVGADGVVADNAARATYNCDAYTVDRAEPDVVVLPRSTEEVAAIVQLCNRLGVPCTPRGTGTGLSGGATPLEGGVVLSTVRMNRILSIDVPNRRLTAQAGCINLNVTKAVSGDGYHFAPDPSSQGACTIGGNVAENSGGPHTLKYGVTANHVTALRMVLPTGEVVTLGSPLEEIWGYDLVGLVVGSEGTLGIVTEVTVRLTPLPQAFRTLLAVFPTVEGCTNAVSQIIAAGIIPAALEMIDRVILNAIEDAFHLGLPRDAAAVLIVEVDGFEAGLDDEAAEIQSVCYANGAVEVRSAASAQDRARLWIARKKGVGAAGRLAPSIITQDGVIPRSKLPYVLREIAGIAAKHHIRVCNIFHAGDGNLHPCVLFDERDADEVQRVLAAGREILELCVRVGGSVTGEHGVGVEKINAMKLMYSDEDLDVMERIRRVFNPDNLCNPGKLFPASHSCVEVKWKPRAAFV
ncbi:MAG: FAD-binding oxidoreductase [Chthonomonadales bacterium]